MKPSVAFTLTYLSLSLCLCVVVGAVGKNYRRHLNHHHFRSSKRQKINPKVRPSRLREKGKLVGAEQTIFELLCSYHDSSTLDFSVNNLPNQTVASKKTVKKNYAADSRSIRVLPKGGRIARKTRLSYNARFQSKFFMNPLMQTNLRRNITNCLENI